MVGTQIQILTPLTIFECSQKNNVAANIIITRLFAGCFQVITDKFIYIGREVTGRCNDVGIAINGQLVSCCMDIRQVGFATN